MRFWIGYVGSLSHVILINPLYPKMVQIIDFRDRHTLQLCNIDIKSVSMIFLLRHICGRDFLQLRSL